MGQQLPVDNKLKELQKIVIDLEIKYDDFNDLGYYFNPLYMKIKNYTCGKSKKIREENKKREIENNVADFDYDKLKDMEYDPNRGCYVEKMERNLLLLTLIQMEVVINMIVMIEALMKMHHII